MKFHRIKALTIRQLYLAVAAGNGHNVAIGTPKQVADEMQEWFENEAADGFNYVPAALPGLRQHGGTRRGRSRSPLHRRADLPRAGEGAAAAFCQPRGV